MNNGRLQKIFAGIVLSSTLVISNFSYADTLQNETDIKKLQNEIKSLQQTHSQLELQLNKLNQSKPLPSYDVAIAKKIGHRGRR